ncbi:MAG: hypothetical protein ACRDFS_09930 [Chloroflexota bacterium]
MPKLSRGEDLRLSAQQVLEALEAFRRGERRSYVTAAERAAVGRPPLPPAAAAIAGQLIGLRGPRDEDEKVVRNIGASLALGVLTESLEWPPVIGNEVTTLRNLQEYEFGPGTLHLDRLVLGERGFRIDTTLEVIWMRKGGKWRTRYAEWEGFASVTDDLGTAYEWTRSLDREHGSVKGEGRRSVQRQPEYWIPAPPPRAQHLLLTVETALKISEPAAAPPSAWPTWEMQVPSLTCRVQLPPREFTP